LRKAILVTLPAVACIAMPALAVPVIPNLSGFGVDTPAGRGGLVYKVTNINNAGPGSLRACIEAAGPRVCVFETSGNIDLGGRELVITNPFITVAGQTAPPPGIAVINGQFSMTTHDILIQHIRTRGGAVSTRRLPLTIDNYRGTAYNIVIDHVSTAWSTDELVHTWWGAHDVTYSHVLATGELNCVATYFDCFGKVMLTDGRDSNIFMANSALLTGYARMPMAEANPMVFVNNLVYNWGGTATQFMRQNATSGGEFVWVGNDYRKGPLNATAWSQKPILIRDDWVPGVHIYLEGNVAPDFKVSQQWDLIDNQSSYTQAQLQVSTPGAWPRHLVARRAADNAVFDYVLDNAGAFPRNRDSVDARLISDVRNRTGGYINSTIFPPLPVNPLPLTLPTHPNDDPDGDGYTNLETWLHGYSALVEGRGGG
jgi:hypothetical protein